MPYLEEQHYTMNNFDFSTYDETEEKPITKQTIPVNSSSSFDFSTYDETEPEKQREDPIYQKYFKSRDINREELKKMSFQDKQEYAQELNRDREYRQSAGFLKNAVSSLTFGFSERSDLLKPQENELLQTAGSIAGDTIPFLGAFKLLGKGVQMIPKSYEWSRVAAHVAGSGVIAGGNEAIREVGKEEEFDPLKIASHAALGSIFDVLTRTVPNAYNWLKRLTKPQQEQLLVKNRIPENMTETDYKFFEDEIVPELQKVGEAEYQNFHKTAVQENDQIFQQEMNNIKAHHENDLFKIQEAEARHAQRTKQIEEANELVMKEYQAAKLEWEATKARESAVRNDMEAANMRASLEVESNTSTEIGLQKEVGDIISPNKTSNATVGGEETMAAVRGSARSDQKQVAKLYEASDELNKGVSQTHPEAANELRGIVEQFKSKGNLTSEEQQLVNNAEKTLNGLIEFGEDGAAIGFKEVDNQFLLDQAKVLRQKMYHDYGESNSTGIYQPLIDLYQDAAKQAAIGSGNIAAAEANDVARAAHREWATLYKNRYIRQWRNLSSNKPESLYKNSLSIDNFRQLNRVLSKSNSGQNLASQIRRDLVNKNLSKFFKDPRSGSIVEFNNALNELEPILNPGEGSRISNSFRQARKAEPMPGMINSNIKEPKPPTLQKIPEKDFKYPDTVKIPTKKPVKPTPEMKEASKLMEITPEEIQNLTKTPTGLKKIKTVLSKSTKGERLLQELHKRKLGEILHQKQYKGRDLHKNVQENYDVIAEILGVDETNVLLEASEKVGDNRVTRENILKFGKNTALIKSLSLFGIL